MSAPVKIKAAKRQAGAMALRLMQDATKEIYEGRECMHMSRARHTMPGLWRSHYHYTKYAVENLRAARLLYDVLPAYAK